jgi:hypothetical protein
MHPTDFETHLTAILHSGSLVSCHIFLATSCILTDDLNQVDRCLIPKV